MTTVLQVVKVDENSYFADFLYQSSTSYSKSLYPTITRTFKKLPPGNYNQTDQNINIDCEHPTYSAKPYAIKRVTWNK